MYWAKELQTDFKDNLYSGLVSIIRNGIKGRYKVKSTHITLSVIYEWISEHKTNNTLPANWMQIKLTEEQKKLLSKEDLGKYNTHQTRKELQ